MAGFRRKVDENEQQTWLPGNLNIDLGFSKPKQKLHRAPKERIFPGLHATRKSQMIIRNSEERSENMSSTSRIRSL